MSDFFIPGFMTVDAPKEEDRIIMRPDGRVELLLMHLDKDAPTPNVWVFVSRERGSRVQLLKSYRDNAFIFEIENPNGGKDVKIRFLPDELIVDPGTYTVTALVAGREIYRKWITVRNHPVLMEE